MASSASLNHNPLLGSFSAFASSSIPPKFMTTRCRISPAPTTLPLVSNDFSDRMYVPHNNATRFRSVTGTPVFPSHPQFLALCASSTSFSTRGRWIGLFQSMAAASPDAKEHSAMSFSTAQTQRSHLTTSTSSSMVSPNHFAWVRSSC